MDLALALLGFAIMVADLAEVKRRQAEACPTGRRAALE
jgi:hypothetical protein